MIKIANLVFIIFLNKVIKIREQKKNMQKTNYKAIALVLGLIAFSFLFVWYIFAFTEPTQNPPGGNVPAPLNVSINTQTKEGGLIIANNSAVTTGLIVKYGNVGIGTTSPAYTLDVNGSARITTLGVGTAPYSAYKIYSFGGDYGIRADGSTAGGYFRNMDGTTSVFLAYGNYGIYQNGAMNFFAGSVGIGTTSPAYTLDVNGSARITALGVGTAPHFAYKIYSSGGGYGIRADGSTAGGYFRDLDDTTTVFLAYGSYGIYQQSLGAMNFFAGNVGIGTPSPAIKLAIGDADTGLQWISADNLAVYTNNVERMRINSAGKVGIGMEPTGWARLQVYQGIETVGTDPPPGEGGAAYYVKNTGAGLFWQFWQRASDGALVWSKLQQGLIYDRMILNEAGELWLFGISEDGTGKVVCVKSNGYLGTCASGVEAGGTCTCQ